MHLGVAATQFRDVCLEPFLIEPAVHLIELFSQNTLNHRHGKLLKGDRLAKDTAEDLSSLLIGQFTSCNLQDLSAKLFRAIKRQGPKGTNIVDGDGLIWFIGTDSVHELALHHADLGYKCQDPNFSLFEVVILHKC